MAAYPSNTLITDFFGLITSGTPHLALYTTNPTAADTGTEVTGGSYSRKAITFGSITGGAVSNTNAMNFSGMPTATVKFYGIRSAATGGTLRTFGAISDIATVSGDEIVIAVGGLTHSFIGS